MKKSSFLLSSSVVCLIPSSFIQTFEFLAEARWWENLLKIQRFISTHPLLSNNNRLKKWLICWPSLAVTHSTVFTRTSTQYTLSGNVMQFLRNKKWNDKATYNSTEYRWSTGHEQLVAGVSRKLIHQHSQTGQGCWIETKENETIYVKSLSRL